MGKYKTVKEVCALTGLTGKHLYYFHHENVVRAAAYANYSVEGNDGYKLYDDAGVEKLQQIALYYQLGLKHNEIRDLMLRSDYDSEAILEALLKRGHSEEARVARQLAALEYLKGIGIQNGLAGSLPNCSLEELGKILLQLHEGTPQADAVDRQAFEAALCPLLHELSCLPDSALHSRVGEELIEKIFALSEKCLGENGKAFVLGLFVAATGEGKLAQIIEGEITSAHGKIVLQYVAKHPELQIFSDNSCVGV